MPPRSAGDFPEDKPSSEDGPDRRLDARRAAPELPESVADPQPPRAAALREGAGSPEEASQAEGAARSAQEARREEVPRRAGSEERAHKRAGAQRNAKGGREGAKPELAAAAEAGPGALPDFEGREGPRCVGQVVPGRRC